MRLRLLGPCLPAQCGGSTGPCGSLTGLQAPGGGLREAGPGRRGQGGGLREAGPGALPLTPVLHPGAPHGPRPVPTASQSSVFNAYEKQAGKEVR